MIGLHAPGQYSMIISVDVLRLGAGHQEFEGVDVSRAVCSAPRAGYPPWSRPPITYDPVAAQQALPVSGRARAHLREEPEEESFGLEARRHSIAVGVLGCGRVLVVVAGVPGVGSGESWRIKSVMPSVWAVCNDRPRSASAFSRSPGRPRASST